jgi:hypothetical protein
MIPLCDEEQVLLESSDPANIYTCSPGIVRLDSGRLVVTDGLRGSDSDDVPEPKYCPRAGQFWQGKVLTSDDGGQTWVHRADFPIMHARPFVAGASLYILGHAGDLMVMRSDDEGETWSNPVALTDGQVWHQAPCNVAYANGCVYLVMERRTRFDIVGWQVGELAPVLMRAKVDDDLTQRSAWTFASELPFYEAVENVTSDPALNQFGVPFFECAYPRGGEVAPGRWCAPIGWLETNVVQFEDPDHIWFDPEGKTFHLWMRAHTGGTGYAAIAKVVEESPGEGEMTTMLETAPSGKQMLFVPCPGGQMKFHILYDDVTALFWLLSTQGTDSMTRPDRLPANRYNLPNNERRRLQLHFSKNCVDWCFAGLVSAGAVEQASRHYASMVIDGADLHVVSRSGDERAKNAHDGNVVTLHSVRDFRALVY